MPAACNTNLTIIIIYTVIRSNPIHVSHRRRSAAAIRRDCILREAIESVVVGQILSFSFPAQLTCWIDDPVVTQTQRERGGKTNGTASFAPTKGTQKKTKKKRNERDLIRKTHGRLAFKTLGIHCALKKNKIKKEMRKRERERVDWPKKLVTGPAAL
jgi:hypothetical protein